MALWNPFNLFKKKAAESEPETGEPVVSPDQDLTQETGAAEASAPSIETPSTETVSTEPAASNAASLPETPKPTVAAPVSPTASQDPVVDRSEPDIDAAQPPVTDESQASDGSESSRSEVESGQPTDSAESESPVVESPEDSARHLPFDQQNAPAQPVDIYQKISQQPKESSRKSTAEATAENAGMSGWFRSAISKTARVLNTDIRDLVGREGRLVDDDFLKELFTHLIKTDMGVGPASKIRDAIGKKYRARKVHLSQLIEEAKTTIAEIMKQEEVRLQLADQGTTVIMVVGVNGSGKTTSIAKLASMFREDGKSVVLGAGDTFRAAAVEQLRQWAGRIGADIVTGKEQSDPASVAYKAAEYAKANQVDICIVDTAGRLQTQTHLMQELSKIRRVLDKVIPGAPHETLLVLDSTAGQNAISQARGFSDAAECTGIVLAKLDGTAKGGVAIPIRQEFGLPVKFIGFGETADAIAPFDVPRYVDALFNFSES